jgi:glycosyltransferase involved in cell wall biosynthesis
MDLVVASLEAWDTVWRRNQHLVAGLLREDPHLRVLFIEPATDPLHAALGAARPRRGRGLRRGPELPGVGADALWLFEPTKWLPRRLDPGVDDRWARQVLRASRTVGMAAPALWVNDPTGALLVTATTWPALYDVTDDWTLADRAAAQLDRVRAQEQVLLEGCAEVVVCSPALAASKGAERPVTVVPNGVDTAAYRARHDRPADLPEPPVALYAGTLHADRLDVDLCVDLCEALAGLAGGPGRLVLVGPDALDHRDSQRLREAGALVLGARPSTDVPAYLQHADVLVVPHVVTPFTDSLDPIKLYEYAAAARPVVSTPVAGFRDSDDPLVRSADGAGFILAVAETLTGTGDPAGPHSDGSAPSGELHPEAAEARHARLSTLDWHDRVRRMRAVLDRLAGAS